jgi:hypothetical protein
MEQSIQDSEVQSITVQRNVFEACPLNEQRSIKLNAIAETGSNSTASEVPLETSRDVTNSDDIGANADCV